MKKEKKDSTDHQCLMSIIGYSKFSSYINYFPPVPPMGKVKRYFVSGKAQELFCSGVISPLCASARLRTRRQIPHLLF